MKITKSSFYPVSSIEGKKNYKKFFRIQKDGSVIERVFLNITEPVEREKIIFLHYMRHVVHHFYKQDVGFNILNRDNPWDFKVELSADNIFNIEVTSIADMNQHFVINKTEEEYLKYAQNEKIQLYKLKKLNVNFPDPDIENIIKEHINAGIVDNDDVDNPLQSYKFHIFLSNMPESEKKLSEHLRDVIDKKLTKNHTEKNNTVLIIDNRSSMFEVSDYIEAAEEIYEYTQSLPFQEIWFYTGYYSDQDGSNAEFSFAPLKISSQQVKVLDEALKNNKIDDRGRLLW